MCRAGQGMTGTEAQSGESGLSGLQESVQSAHFARQIGYLMFFNLKRNDAAMTISEKEVHDAEVAAGLHNAHTWRLFNRDGDLSSTLQELMEGTERVFNSRETIANTLVGNVAVVRQVESAIGALLLIIWVFIAAAIFDPDNVQRVWTALSAGLLSFSFIFSNTIREVRTVWLQQWLPWRRASPCRRCLGATHCILGPLLEWHAKAAHPRQLLQ